MRKRVQIHKHILYINAILRQSGPDRELIQSNLYRGLTDPLRPEMWYELGVQLYRDMRSGT